MTIGKRKGSAAKGAGGTGREGVNKVGGSLSKNDHWYLGQAFGLRFDPGLGEQTSMVATGGDINDYTSPDGSVYRSHTFTSSGTFTCTSLGVNLPGSGTDSVEVLLVAGGGGGGFGEYHGSGGGAGGYLEGPVTVTGSTDYTLVVGAGGNGGSPASNSVDGLNTTLLDPGGGPYTYTASGGGAGVHTPNGQGVVGESGGSGSGASGWSQPGGTGTAGEGTQAPGAGPNGTLTGYGNDGGSSVFPAPTN